MRSAVGSSSVTNGGWHAKVCCDLRQPFAERLANVGEDTRASVAQLLFGGRGDTRDDFAGLVVERSDCSKHPLVGHILQASAKILSRLLANARIQPPHLRLLRLSHRFPRCQQRTESALHFLVGFCQTS